MGRFTCTVLFDASNGGDEIEAESAEAAEEIALNERGSVSLCHQCSYHVDMGDALGVIVYDEDGKMVRDSTYHAEEIARLNARIEELEAELARRPNA